MDKFKTEKLPDGGTCRMYNNGDKFYFNAKGELHRGRDLPAVQYKEGDAAWYTNGLRDRSNDKPAIMDSDGYKAWYRLGKLHRESGPAVIRPGGVPSFYVNDVRVDEAELHPGDESLASAFAKSKRS